VRSRTPNLPGVPDDAVKLIVGALDQGPLDGARPPMGLYRLGERGGMTAPLTRRSVLAGLGGAALTVGVHPFRGADPDTELVQSRPDVAGRLASRSSSRELLLTDYRRYVRGADWGRPFSKPVPISRRERARN
jgi:hypothetical protein